MCNFDHYYLSFCVFSIVVYMCKILYIFTSKECMCTQSNRQYLCKSCDLEDKEYGAVAVADLLAEQVYVWKTSKGKPYDVKLLRIHGKKKCMHINSHISNYRQKTHR